MAKFDPVRGIGRVTESDLIGWRGTRIQSLQDWKNRLSRTDMLARGDWSEVFTDESSMREFPHVMNMVQVGLDDIARLVSEAVPSVRCFPSKETQSEEEGAHLREAVADTYWAVNNAEMLVPRLAMDIAGCGAAFVASYVDKKEAYPCFHRIDPRTAYPDVINGKIQDLLVLEDLNARTAARMYPDLHLENDPNFVDMQVELLHYYSETECLQAIVAMSSGSNPAVYTTKRWDPKGVMPVAMVQLDSFDGGFRGMFDQIAGSLQTKNRLVKMVLEYMDELVYAPLESSGVLNPEEPPGPLAHYRLDPNNPNAKIGRVQPAGSSPEVFSLLEFLDREQRAGVGYPSARQGEVSQSIASASFVASTQGQLTTTVKNIQRLLADMRRQLNEIAFFQDEQFLNTEKALQYPIGNKKMYKPKTAIGGNYKNVVVYGAAAGLDRMQADVRVMQLMSAGIISKQDAREQIDFVNNPSAVQGRVDLETTQNIALQKFLSDAPPEQLLMLLKLQAEGKSLADALKMLADQQQAMMEQQQAQGGAPGGAPGEAPPGAAMQQQQMEKGAAPPQPAFAPPPLEQIVVHGGSR